MKKLIVFLSLLFIVNSLLAAVTAAVDRTQVAMGESLTLTINLPNSNSQPDLSPLNQNFQVYGTSTNSSTSIINGKRSSQYKIIATLMPKHPGKLTIPALHVGQQQTQPIVVTVTKATATHLGGHKSDAFLQASASTENPYVDSPVVYTLKLYFARSLQDGNILPTQVSGVKMRPLGQQKNYSAGVNHKNYQVIEQQYLLSVDHAGKITIPGVAFQGSMISNTQSDMFGFPSSKPIRLVSNPVSFDVKAIPSDIDPNQWLPAQKVTLYSDWSPQTQQLTMGEPITRTVTLAAVGINANNLPDISFKVPANVNAYPDQPTTTEKIVDGQLWSEKTYKIAYVPTQQGKLTFPAITVNWWDTTTDSTKSTSLAAKTFPVLAGQLTASVPTLIPSVASTTSVVQPTSKTLIKKETNPLWQWLTFIFAGSWLVTMIYCLMRRTTFHKITSRSPAEHKTPNLAELRQACENNHAKLIQHALIKWAQAYWQDKQLTSLAMVANQFADKEVTAQIRTVEKAIYTGQGYTEGAKLWQVIHGFLKQKTAKPKDDELKPLYPR